MRKVEIIGLQWSDIDLERNVIHVRRSANVNKGKAILGETKSEAGTRDIPIMPELMKNLVPFKTGGYVLTSTKDPTYQQPISGTVYNCMIKRTDKTISLHGATARVFRYTLGTLVYSETKDAKIVQDILGHSNFKTTADRYVHPEKSREQSAMERVNNALLFHVHNETGSATG